MNRLADFMDFLQEDMAQQYAHMCQAVHAEMLKNPSHIEDKLHIAISDLLKNRIQQEKINDGLEPIQYLVVSPLHSSLLTQSYEYSLMLMNETLYLDRHMTEVFWRPPYIFDHIQQAIGHFEVRLKRKFIRIKQYEIDELRIAFAIAHLGLFNAMIMEYASTIEANKNWSLIKRSHTVQVMLGGYMDKLLPLKELKFGVEAL